MIIGSDTGFGYAKGTMQSVNGIQTVSFPNFVHDVGKDMDLVSQCITESRGEAIFIEYDNHMYLIGDEVVEQFLNDAQRNRTPKRYIVSEFWLEFMGILAAFTPPSEKELPIDLVFGLPVDVWETSKDEYEKEILARSPFKFTVYGKYAGPRNLNIRNVYVVPQPLGTMVKYFYDTNGDLYSGLNIESIRTGIIDIGHETCDYVIYNGERRSKSIGTYGSIPGVIKIKNQLSHELAKEPVCCNVDEAKLDQLFISNGADLAVHGEIFNVRKQMDAVITSYSQQLVSKITGFWSAEINNLDLILLTGGGASLCARHIDRMMRPYFSKDIAILNSSQFANALGYLQLGLAKFGNQ